MEGFGGRDSSNLRSQSLRVRIKGFCRSNRVPDEGGRAHLRSIISEPGPALPRGGLPML